MKLIAIKEEYAVIEKDDRWEMYNLITRIIVDTIWKATNKFYGYAVVDKWGFDEINPPLEIESYAELMPDLDILMLTPDEVKKQKQEAQHKFLMEHVEQMNPEEKKQLRKDLEKLMSKKHPLDVKE
jgi:hypothetical protein